jgi:CheY-like chemotaxis protein
MSHEIRTPMNGIIGAADILKGMELGKDEYKMVEIIHKSGNSLLTIINDILDFSKIEAGKMEIEYAPFNLLKSIEEVIEMLKHNALKKNLELIYYLDSNIKNNVLGDETRINQVLINLIGNAIKFTENGQVFLKVDLIEESEKYYSLKFSIEDTGIGIPKEKQSKIFESFTQANGSTTRRFGGTGLGTTISKMLVNLMGGEISVISPNPNSNFGQGSIFYFTLKLKKDKLTPKTTIINNEIKGKKALIIDDNETNCFVLNKMLANWKIKAIETYSGKQALEILKNNNNFDIIFIDYNMPENNGFDVIELIKSKLKNGTKKIMISSNSTDLTTAKAKKYGFDLLLYKPLKQSELYNSILKLYSKNIKIEQKKEATKKYNFSDIKILIAEDNPINQKIALSVFKQVGLNAVVAENGKVALDILKNKKFDIVFMDVQMPVIDGIKATNIMRANGNETIVVAMTANAMKGDKEMCINAGMNEYISKPFKKEDVYKILEKYF